ncbi:MAG: sugar phosphate isomerase/epimerase [Clostridia bacterium]|nr:sugar phosphate isomerase/epimerase [Clostridia bacterium]
MKISTEIISSFRIVGAEKAVETIAKAGFDAWDFSVSSLCSYDYKARVCSGSLFGNDYLKAARRLKQIGLDNGIHCNQSHAPSPSEWPTVRSSLKRAIECTAEAGGSICIIHPFNNGTPEVNRELYLELLPFAREHGVKIATENMFNWDSKTELASFAACATPESFNAHLDAVNDDYLVACLDIGHAEMSGSGTNSVELIHALGNRLKALHIHDNDKRRDQHKIPFSGAVDFAPIVKALKDVGYDGYFTLEASKFLKDFTADTVLDGAKKLAESARKLVEMYEIC